MGMMVLMAGLEPARFAARDFKSPVSAIPPHQRMHIIASVLKAVKKTHLSLRFSLKTCTCRESDYAVSVLSELRSRFLLYHILKSLI